MSVVVNGCQMVQIERQIRRLHHTQVSKTSEKKENKENHFHYEVHQEYPVECVPRYQYNDASHSTDPIKVNLLVSHTIIIIQ